MNETLIVEFDGGSRGNPGPAGIGVVVRVQDGTPLVTLGRFIGRATNNVAEYNALITGLKQARTLGAKKVQVRGDSELIIKQMRGEYRVRHPDLKPLSEEARELAAGFDEVSFTHSYREKNELADKLANLAMDRKGDVFEADAASVDAPAPAEAQAGDRFACPRCGCVVHIETPTRIRPHQLRDFICQCGQRMNRQ